MVEIYLLEKYSRKCSTSSPFSCSAKVNIFLCDVQIRTISLCRNLKIVQPICLAEILTKFECYGSYAHNANRRQLCLFHIKSTATS